MIEQIISYLKDKGVIQRDIVMKSIQLGAGGAKLYIIKEDQNEYILKSYHPSYHNDESKLSSYEMEYKFYQYFVTNPNEKVSFLPRIKYIEHHRDYGIMILMERLGTIAHMDWKQDNMKAVMDKIAYFHSLTNEIVGDLGILDHKNSITEVEIMHSYEDWRKVLQEHSGRFEEEYLDIICSDIKNLEKTMHQEPRHLCHGDFHPENILSNGYELFLCDWQGLSIGKGIGDVSFFLSRGKEMNIPMDEDIIIDNYYHALNKYGISIEKNVLYEEMYSSYILTTFLFWSFYLHNSSYERVSGQYDSMVDMYKKLMNIRK